LPPEIDRPTRRAIDGLGIVTGSIGRRFVLCASGLLLATVASCAPEPGGTGGPTVTFHVSEPLSPCPGLTLDDPCAAADAGIESYVELRRDLATADFELASLEARAVAEEGAAALRAATGLGWTDVTADSDDALLDLAALAGQRGQRPATIWVGEVVSAEEPRRALLSLASAGGVAVWVNGAPHGVSRYPIRPLTPNDDVLAVDLRAGANLILYKVRHDGSGRWNLYREWHEWGDLDALIDAAVGQGAFADLPTWRVFPDTATGVGIKGPWIRVEGGPVVRFRWLTLLGEVMETVEPEAWPEWLAFPAGFTGGAILEYSAVDPFRDSILFREQMSVYRRSDVFRMGRELLARAPDGPADPVLAARVDLVRHLFATTDETVDVGSGWLYAQAVVDLVRRLDAPERFHTFPGIQAWGYTSPIDGTVQPFWLLVPPSVEGAAAGSGADGVGEHPLPLVLTVFHARDPVFWRGRGGSVGSVNSSAVAANVADVLGVVPFLRDVHAFGDIGTREIPALIDQIDGYVPVDRESVGLLVWSDHALAALLLAADPGVPLSHVGMAVPALDRDPAVLRPLLRAARANPRVTWTVWSGEDDDMVPTERVAALVDLMRVEGLPTTWVSAPHASHTGGMYENMGLALSRSVREASESERVRSPRD
jgi:hypothetical protein